MKAKLLLLVTIVLLLSGCATTQEIDQLNARIDWEHEYLTGRIHTVFETIKALAQRQDEVTDCCVRKNETKIDAFTIEYIGRKICEAQTLDEVRIWINELCKRCEDK